MQSNSEAYSVIDLGTNTCLLLIGEIYDGKIKKLFEALEVPRLGRGLYRTGIISENAFDEVVRIFEKYIAISKEHCAKKIFAFGTSALRDAKNRDEFIKFIEERTGLEIQLISGDDEAKYSYWGATFDLEKTDKYAVLDIGGGSTELCYMPADIISGLSIDIGSVRLCELFFNGAFAAEKIITARSFLNDKIAELDLADERCELVGVAGTATTLSALKNNLNEFDETIIDKDILTYEQLERLILKLTSMTADERLSLGNYMKGRSDIIICGALIMYEIMKRLKKKKIMIRTTGLRYGLLLNIKHYL